jgi:hypothetical protein
MLATMSRMLCIACFVVVLLDGPAAAQGFGRGPHMGFAPHPGFFPLPGLFSHPGFFPHRAFFPRRTFDNRRFFFGGVFVAPPIIGPPYPAYPYFPYYYPPIPTRHIPSVPSRKFLAVGGAVILCAR